MRVVEEGASALEVRAAEADALVTAVVGMSVGIRTADCVPVLVGDARSGAVAAVHAGWRGAVAGVLNEALTTLCARVSTFPADLLVAIGPHIRVDAFEIGEEVAVQLEKAAGPGFEDVVRRGDQKPHGDLAVLLRSQLRTLGVPTSSVDDVGRCTYSDQDHFFSYRREPGEKGRQLSWIQSCANRLGP